MSGQPNDGSRGPRPRASLFGRGRRPAPALGDPSPPPAKEPKRPRRSILSSVSAFLTFVLVGALLAIGAVAWLAMEWGKPGPLTADKIVNIVREDDGSSIAEQLERAGVIDNAMWFNLLTLFDGNRAALKRGEYEFKAGDSLRQVEARVMSGKVVLHPLTIPEGLTSEQVVQRVRDAEFLGGDVKESPREGSILPETYDFPRGFGRQAALARMEKHQAKLVDEIWRRRAPDLPIKSPGEMVILASIVEKETGKADERPRVAGVFVNRLQKHMRLESDPTIVYGLAFGKGTLGRPITRADLNQVTPYNTYIIDGLPPGPISNPGKAALEAVANPVRSKDLYFVADGTGGHVFANSFEQHLKNVAHWRQVEKDAKDRLAPDVAPLPAPSAIHGEIRLRRSHNIWRASCAHAGAAGAGSGSCPPRQDRRRPQRDGLRAGVAVAGVPRGQVDRRARRHRRRGQQLSARGGRVRRRGPGRPGRQFRRLGSAPAGDARRSEGARGQIRDACSRRRRRRCESGRPATADGLRPAADL